MTMARKGSLVESQNNRTKARVVADGRLECADLVVSATPEHGPEIEAKLVSVRGLVNTPVVDAGVPQMSYSDRSLQ